MAWATELCFPVWEGRLRLPALSPELAMSRDAMMGGSILRSKHPLACQDHCAGLLSSLPYKGMMSFIQI